ncbi:MAG: hypothetical protein MUE44_14940 [Oscillatoriaceae cyanobacterium Prado104]|jgi:hypothetical protein|nr:hypothetical protein [Oscillatoriaceae cyanobacterium Prado104]
MIRPCSQPLKTNPFTSYRDPVTGKWIVVNKVENVCEADSSLKPPVPSPEASQAEPKPQVQQHEVLQQPNRLSFSLLPFKKPARKSAVNVRS